MKNLFFDEWGRLSQTSIKLYADAMKRDRLEELPQKLYDYVQEHPECLSLILEQFDEFSNIVLPKNLVSSDLVSNLQELRLTSLPYKVRGKEGESDGNRAPSDELRKLVSIVIPDFNQTPPLRLERMREATLLKGSRKLNIKHPSQDEIFLNLLKVELESPCEETIYLDIYNSKDEIVISSTIPPNECLALLDFEKLDLQTGLYYIRLGHGTIFVTERFYFLSEEDQEVLFE